MSRTRGHNNAYHGGYVKWNRDEMSRDNRHAARHELKKVLRGVIDPDEAMMPHRRYVRGSSCYW